MLEYLPVDLTRPAGVGLGNMHDGQHLRKEGRQWNEELGAWTTSMRPQPDGDAVDIALGVAQRAF
eukprot:scaffold155178_cov29-Tisochrysis_lutea.AAC.2